MPLGIGLGKAKVVAPDVTGRFDWPGMASASPEPRRPTTVPPTVYELVTHVTATFVMFPLPIMPVPFATVQVCAGDVGW